MWHYVRFCVLQNTTVSCQNVQVPGQLSFPQVVPKVTTSQEALVASVTIITLAAFSGKRNVTVCPSVCLSRLFLSLIERATHTQRN